MRRTLRLLATTTLALTASCTEPEASPAPLEPPAPLGPLAEAPLTTSRTLALGHAVETAPNRDPRVPEDLEKLLEEGYGESSFAEGRPITPKTLDGSPAPAAGPSPKRVARFFHLADAQLADDESPTRLCAFDGPGTLAGPFRAQEGYECRILDAAVRTMNAAHAETPVEFVVLGGDNVDNAQTNELDWFRGILEGGGIVSCDSGADDDPVPGPGNDPKDPFAPVGLDMPWYWVTGNHDALVQGTFVVDLNQRERTLSDFAAGGTRDYRLRGGPLTKADVVPDERRALVDHAGLVEKLAADGVRGIGPDVLSRGRANYTFDSADGSVRFVVFDSTSPVGSSEGLVRKNDMDDFLEPALAAAEAEKKWVVLVSHHSSRMLTDGGEAGGTAQPDAILPDAFRAAVGAHPNVIAHIAGHTHVHSVTAVTAMQAANPYWEVETSALADWPHQVRLVEIWDMDNGFLSLRSVALDYATDGDPVAQEGRRIANADFTSGWGQNSMGAPEDGNVELFVPKVP
jgi:3',5'-cyclic AMP phosphodiesterase CpdA